MRMGLFNSLQFILAGMRVEQFTYMSRSATLRGSNETLEWTSQFYLNNSINEQVHTQPPYNRHGPVDITNEEDFIYTGPSNDGLVKTNTGQHLMLKINGNEQQGYTGIFNIGVNANQSKP